MARFIAGTDEGNYVISVKLDGKEVLKELAITAADTDEGWLDIVETEILDNGKRHPVMQQVSDGKYEMVKRRIYGKVEVSVGIPE